MWGHTIQDEWQPVFAAWSFLPFQSRPLVADCDPLRPSTPFATLQTALADGSVRGINTGISGETWWALCTPDGGEVPGNDW